MEFYYSKRASSYAGRPFTYPLDPESFRSSISRLGRQQGRVEFLRGLALGNFDTFEVPQHLTGILQLHSKLSRRLEIGGNDLTPTEVTKLKKQKLTLRDAIAKSSYDPDRGPRISDTVVHPLTLDTLQLLQSYLKELLVKIRRNFGPTSTKISGIEAALKRVEARMAKLSPNEFALFEAA